MTTVLIHPYSSLLSAYGMGLASIRATREQAIEHVLNEETLGLYDQQAERLLSLCFEEVTGQGVDKNEIILHRRALLRYAGTDSAIEIDMPKGSNRLQATLWFF